MKICGRCVYWIGGTMCICLAPCKAVIGKSLDRRDECIAPEWYTENTRSQLKRAIFVQRAKDAITNQPPREEGSGEPINLNRGSMAGRVARNAAKYGYGNQIEGKKNEG